MLGGRQQRPTVVLGSVLIDELILHSGNTVYLVTIIGTLFALVGDCYHHTCIMQSIQNGAKMEVSG